MTIKEKIFYEKPFVLFKILFTANSLFSRAEVSGEAHGFTIERLEIENNDGL